MSVDFWWGILAGAGGLVLLVAGAFVILCMLINSATRGKPW